MKKNSFIVEKICNRILELSPDNFDAFIYLFMSIPQHRTFLIEEQKLFEFFFETFKPRYSSFEKDEKDAYVLCLIHYIYFCSTIGNHSLQNELMSELIALNPNYKK